MGPQHAPQEDKKLWLVRWGMLLCCLAIVVPVAIVMIFGTGLTALSGNLWIALPLVACLSIHFVMHRITGRSCHTSDPDCQENTTETPKV